MKKLKQWIGASLFVLAASHGLADDKFVTLVETGDFSRPMPKSSFALLGIDQEVGTLVAGRRGFVLFNARGERLVDSSPAAEMLDLRESVTVRRDGQVGKLAVAASVALPEQQPIIMTIDVDGRRIDTLVRLPIPEFKIANLCLSRVTGDQLSLYLLDERGVAQHWLVLDEMGNTQVRHIRDLVIPPGSTSCRVDDLRQTLYVAEKGVGVWAYDAAIESDGSRQVLDLVTPYGQLSSSAEAVATAQGLVFALAPKAKQLLVYNSTKSNSLVERLPINLLGKPDAISARWNSLKQQIDVVIYDDKSARVYQVEFPWQVASSTSKNTPSVTPMVSIKPEVQTQVMARFGDAADDPAIWVNEKNPSASRVIGTNKQQGLFVYDLQGRELQHFDTGRLNNVDLRRRVKMSGQVLDLVIATNRDDESLALFVMDDTGTLSPAGRVPTGLKDIYGFCMYQSPTNSKLLYAFPNSKSGVFEQIKISGELQQGQWHFYGEKQREFAVSSQPEGCVADDVHQRLFLGEEDVGIWTIGAEPTAGTTPTSVAKVGGHLVDDVEGMGLYLGPHHSYLVVSSQGNNTYVIYDAKAPYTERGIVRVELDAEKGIDGSSETDGLDVTSHNLGGVFSEGMLVVQDGHKVMPAAPQNFKYISWEKIRRALKLPN